MTDESNIYLLESPVFLRLDKQELLKVHGFHPIRELSETKLHIATKVRLPIENDNIRYYKLLGDDTFYHERFFRIVQHSTVN